MTVFSVINLAVTAVELLIVGLMVNEARKIGGGVPRIVWGLIAFFVIDALVALNRSELFWERSDYYVNATVLDAMALFILLVLFTNARRIAQGAIATVDMARFRAQEYERARSDYTQVVRHRIMNPVTVILGAAETLRCGALTDKELADRLLLAIEESATVIRDETLVPERRDSLERGLDASPRFEKPPKGT